MSSFIIGININLPLSGGEPEYFLAYLKTKM